MSMAGVACPMVRREPSSGGRFLLGLAFGSAAGALALSAGVYLVGRGIAAVLPQEERVLITAGVCFALGLADLTNTTPQVWRQVPQPLMRVLPPGTLGTAWGVDLGLLFTTQKATSLIWAVLAVGLFSDPAAVPWLLLAVVGGSSLALARRVISNEGELYSITANRRLVRIASGVILVLLCLITIIPSV
jgi:hypothetical protein